MTYGTAFSAGNHVHPPAPASASEAPMRPRNRRREMESLSMADIAVRQLAGWTDFIAADELLSQVFGFSRVIGRLPIQIVNFSFGPQVFSWVLVTVQALLHVKRMRFRCEWHPIDLAVTTRAADTFRNVDAVVEVDVTGNVVDLRPAERTILEIAAAHGLENLGVRPNLGVTSHAGLRGRKSGVRRGF